MRWADWQTTIVAELNAIIKIAASLALCLFCVDIWNDIKRDSENAKDHFKGGALANHVSSSSSSLSSFPKSVSSHPPQQDNWIAECTRWNKASDLSCDPIHSCTHTGEPRAMLKCRVTFPNPFLVCLCFRDVCGHQMNIVHNYCSISSTLFLAFLFIYAASTTNGTKPLIWIMLWRE